MKKHLLLVLLLVFFFFLSRAQTPSNIIPNPSFEDGTFVPNVCIVNDNLHGSGYNLLNWKAAEGTPDWFDHLTSTCTMGFGRIPCPSNPFDQNRYIRLGSTTVDKEAITAQLSTSLINGKKYQFRMLVSGWPTTRFAVHFTENSNNWINSNHKMFWAATIVIPSNPIPDQQASGCNVFVLENIITATTDNLKNIIIQNVDGLAPLQFYSGGLGWIDGIELYDFCSETLVRANRIYNYNAEKEEANYITAGSVINNGPAQGDVEMQAGSTTIYKANTEVKLVEGFNVYRGADFTAKIGACGSNCPSSNISIPTDYTICDNECITIGANSLPSISGMSYLWKAVIEDHNQYLSSSNVAQPVFCPPGGSSGTYTYNLTITNACGESTIKTVYIHYDSESNPNPEFTITNSNLGSEPDNPSFTINTAEHTEYVSVDILDCNNNVLHSNIYINGVDFTAPQEVNWQFTGFMSPCACYKIRVRSKNYCYEELKEESFEWERIKNPKNMNMAHVTICENGKRKICFTGSGLAQIRVQLINRWTNKVMDETKSVTSNPFCIEIPDNNLSSGSYFMNVTFIGCDGSKIIIPTTSIMLLDCGSGLVGGGGTWYGDDYNEDIYYSNPENGTVDSLYSIISPNPVFESAIIRYHVPKAGTVKISLMNANFEEKAILVQNENNPVGDYEVQFSNSELLTGVNYYMIELLNEQNARHIKRFSVVK